MRHLHLVCLTFIAALWMLVVALPAGEQVDKALAEGHFLCGPQYSGLLGQFSGCNPYSPLWYLLNPSYWTQLPYHVFLLSAVSIMLAIYIRLNKKGVIPDWVVIGWLFTNVCWFTFHSESDVMVTLFAPLSLVAWQLSLLMPAMKLPIFWSVNHADSHWACGFDPNYPYAWCSGFHRWDFGMGGGLVYTYGALGFWFFLPALVQAWRVIRKYVL